MTKNNPTLQENIAALDELLAWFDSDNFSLEDATKRFSEAESLAGVIETQLHELKNDITIVKQRFDEAA